MVQLLDEEEGGIDLVVDQVGSLDVDENRKQANFQIGFIRPLSKWYDDELQRLLSSTSRYGRTHSDSAQHRLSILYIIDPEIFLVLVRPIDQ